MKKDMFKNLHPNAYHKKAPRQIINLSRQEFSQVIVEERDSFITVSYDDINPDDYIDPEYETGHGSETKVNLQDELQDQAFMSMQSSKKILHSISINKSSIN